MTSVRVDLQNFTVLTHWLEIKPCFLFSNQGFKCLAGGRVITVFSATNYCGSSNNDGAMLHVVDAGDRWRILPKYIGMLQRMANFFVTMMMMMMMIFVYISLQIDFLLKLYSFICSLRQT
jgi:hypothetical protein